jgi:hypothetical protein
MACKEEDRDDGCRSDLVPTTTLLGGTTKQSTVVGVEVDDHKTKVVTTSAASIVICAATQNQWKDDEFPLIQSPIILVRH